MIFPCGTANYYSTCPSGQTQTPHLYLLQLLDTNQLTHPYLWCMDNALVRYTPYTTGRGGLTITYVPWNWHLVLDFVTAEVCEDLPDMDSLLMDIVEHRLV